MGVTVPGARTVGSVQRKDTAVRTSSAWLVLLHTWVCRRIDGTSIDPKGEAAPINDGTVTSAVNLNTVKWPGP
eukprot:3601013-Rhodomonas_salina.3